MFIKICGMTRRKDVEFAAELGVDAVGLIFAPSPRRVTPEQARRLTDSLTGVLKVGVFVNEQISAVVDIRRLCALDIIQLHGDESPDYCSRLGGSLFKALRVKDETIFQQFDSYPSDITFLLDAFVKGTAGGAGASIAHRLLDSCPDFSRVIVAGGIGTENVEELIHRYAPFGVDANSRLETAPGVKNYEAMQRFVEAVRGT